jgi:hypothetical protein
MAFGSNPYLKPEALRFVENVAAQQAKNVISIR